MAISTLEHSIIKILVDTLKKYADKTNWNESPTGESDQFGVKGDGFEIAQEALEEVYKLIEEENNKKVYLPSGNVVFPPTGSPFSMGSAGTTGGGSNDIYKQYFAAQQQYTLKQIDTSIPPTAPPF